MKKFFVIFAAIALVGAFATTTMAADWSFYGSARVQTWSYDDSKEQNDGVNSDRDTTWELQGNSRLGANVAAGDVTGRVELGLGTGAAISTRLIYGTWNFGGGELLIGQTYSPITTFFSNQVAAGDNDLLNWGEIYAGRVPMIQLKFGGFKLAFMQPNGSLTAAATTYTTLSTTTTAASVTGVTGAAGGPWADTDTTLPKIEASYRYATDMWFAKVYGGYNSFDAVNATDNSTSVTSYIFGVGGAVTFGPATIKANLYSMANPVAYGAGTNAIGSGVWKTATEMEDCNEFGGLLLAVFKFNDKMSLEAGVGMVSDEVAIPGAKQEQTITSMYLNLPITLADGVSVTPEIGKFDYDKLKVGGAETKMGDTTYVGAKWQINF